MPYQLHDFPKKAPNLEWEVVNSSGVSVHRTKSLQSGTLVWRPSGWILVGHLEQGWLKLFHAIGYVKFTLNGSSQLKARKVSYVKITSGTCADIAAFPITNIHVCEVAAFTLGVPNYIATAHKWIVPAPEGCYVKAGMSVWLAKTPTDKGNGVIGIREPICSSHPYMKLLTTLTVTSSTATSGMTATTTLTRTSTKFMWQGLDPLNSLDPN